MGKNWEPLTSATTSSRDQEITRTGFWT